MTARSPEMEAFVAEARAVRILDAFRFCGRSLSTLRSVSGEYVGPCPSCGGRDRFALNERKNAFFCRSSEGGDSIALAQHLTGQDFLDACEILTGRERPDHARETEREKARRQAEAVSRVAEMRRQAEADDRRREAEENEYRWRELQRCGEIWHSAERFDQGEASARAYLEARGLDVAQVDGAYLRTHPHLGFFCKPQKGAARAIHHGPAMVARFVEPIDGRWRALGIHQTWIDLAAAPKFRPDLHDPETGEVLPTKKMRGTKLGGLIPVLGRISTARRMVAGEGIETALGFARWDGFRPDTFYCAAGDLGNLCGKATQRSRFQHPTLRKAIKGGRPRRVIVQGVEPDMASSCLPVPDFIEELVLLGDGDSEPVMTRAALKRGCARHARDGRTVRSLFAPDGMDWGEVKVDEAA